MNNTSHRSLRTGTDHLSRWYPVSIDAWENTLCRFSRNGAPLLPDKDIRRNIAYNLQYLEYLEQTLLELGLSAVLEKQTYKSYIIIATGIVESLLFFVVSSSGIRATKLVDILNAAESKELLGTDSTMYDTLQRFRKLRNKVHLFELRDDLGTDYSSFGGNEFEQMRSTLLAVVSHSALGLPGEQGESFSFLSRQFQKG